MTKPITWLTGVLSLQVVLIILPLVFGNTNAEPFKATALFNFNQKQLDKIIISDLQAEVVIEKISGKWVLPKLNHLSANANEVDALINRLVSLRTKWPVATTVSSHQRFEVSEDAFRRKLELFSNDTSLGVLFLGTSPGFKKSHLRMAGNTEIFALELNAYDAPVSADEWLDKMIIATQAITRIKSSEFELIKKNDLWEFNNADNGEIVDLDQANTLNSAFATLRVMGVADDAPKMQGGDVVTLEVSSDKILRYQLLESKGDHYIKRSDIDPIFRLNEHVFKRLTEADKVSLKHSATINEETTEP